MTATAKTHHRTCTLCEAMCGIKIQVENNQVSSIKGDKDDPFSRGYLCPKASALAELHEDPDRIRRPMIREGESWREASWDEALDKAAALIHNTQKQYDRNAVAAYLGNPNVHNFGALFYIPQFLRTLKSRNRFSATSLDQLPHMFAAYQMFGHQLLMSIPDIDHTDYMLVIGGNPLASNGSIMSAPDIRNRLKGITKRGGELHVLDPRRTETAGIATAHHFIRPDSDAALLMSMIHVVCHERSPSLGHLLQAIKGMEQIRYLSQAWTPERAEGITGISAEQIRDFANNLLERDKAICYGRMGTSTQQYGGLNHWLINVLNILCNNMDVRGGMMFTQPAVDLINAPAAVGSSPGHFDKWQSRVRGLPEFGGELPTAALAEDIDTRGEGQIRGLVTLAGNPVLSAPNGQRLEAALPGLEAYVAIDYFLNETTRHAHVILPPVSPLERSHYDLVFHALAVRNTAKYSDPVFAKPKDAREDWQIMQALSERLERLRGHNGLKDKAMTQLQRQLTPERFLSTYFTTLSPYRGIRGNHPETVSMKKLRENPQGIDLGPLQPCLLERLGTRDKMIDLAPQCLIDDCKRLDALKAPGEEYLLIGRRHIRSCNSWLHNAPKLKKGKSLCTMLIHPQDAEKLALKNAEEVRVSSRVGEVSIAVEVSDEIMPGVVSIPHGYGHDRKNMRLSEASRNPGASINDLTDDQRIDPLTGNAAFSGTPVTIQAIQA